MRIYNSISRQKEALKPLFAGHLRLYACGPTVYDLSHIGHARVFVAFDMIVRYLRRFFQVTYVRNITDIDDKIIARANKANESPLNLSQRFTAAFHEDLDVLNCLPPDIEPRVTEHMSHIIAMIEQLLATDVAYISEGDVYFAVEQASDYGHLSRRTLDDMEAGARVQVSDKKRHPMDFALWKTAKPGEPFWPSPWGNGRPGWHIECSAMSKHYLGATFDIHAGGRDLLFPHHENEIAQSHCANQAPMAKVWVHAGLVNINNEKMSKSQGNFFTIRDVLQNFDPQTLRFYLLSVHYRSSVRFDHNGLIEAETRIKYFYETLNRLRKVFPQPFADNQIQPPYRDVMVETLSERFDQAMSDDFNTPQVVALWSGIFRLINDILDHPQDEQVDQRTLAACCQALAPMAQVMGVLHLDADMVLVRMNNRRIQQQQLNPQRIEKLINERQVARQNKNFTAADKLRAEIEALGVILHDSRDGVTWEVANRSK